MESVKRVQPFHLSSPHYRCYRKKKPQNYWQNIAASLFRVRNFSGPKLKQLEELINSYFLSTCVGPTSVLVAVSISSKRC